MFRALKIITGTLALIIAVGLTIWIGGFIVFTGVISSMSEPKQIEKTDAIIVLTGGNNRVARALDLLAEDKSDHLFISGVNKGVKLSELVTLWGYKRPLPDCCIILGYEAESTLGNALEARKWIQDNKIKTIRLITATYHMPRSLLEFHHALPDNRIISHPVIPENFTPDTKNFWKLSFLEYHKLLISLVRVLFFPADVTPLPAALK